MSIEILVGNCRKLMANMLPESVNCVVTSPPYWGLRDYKLPPLIWGGDADCAHEWSDESQFKRSGGTASSTLGEASGGNAISDEARLRSIEPSWNERSQGQFCHHCSAWLGCLGLEPTPELYVEHIVKVFQEVRRVLRKDGTLWLNMGDCYAGSPNGRSAADVKALGNDDRTFRDKPFSTVSKSKRIPRGSGRWGGGNNTVANLKPKDLVMMPARVALALQADGWWLRSEIVWAKPNPMPESIQDRPTTAHEKVFLLTRSARYFYDAEAVREAVAPSQEGRVRDDVIGGSSWQERDQHSKGGRYQKMPDGWDTGSGAHGTIHRQGREKGQKRAVPPRHSRYPSSDRATLSSVESGAGRNLRNVWHIATAPYRDAHFATFPPKLVEPCIKAGTSEKGSCPVCRAPWVQEVDVEYDNPGNRSTNGPRSIDRKHLEHGSAGYQQRLEKRVRTLGWRPSCDTQKCGWSAQDPASGHTIIGPEPHDPDPCTVLDPFAGAGTVGLVANRLGRDVILIELNPKYAEMARRRIQDDAPLFTEIKGEEERAVP